MDFALTAEQKAIRDAAREFAEKEVSPHVEELDEAQKFPREILKKAAELGFLGIIFPEELGGAGFGNVEYVLVVTELSKVDPSVGISVAAHNSLCTNHIYKNATAEQRQRWIPKLASGEWIGAWALTEAGSGSDAASMSAAPRPASPAMSRATRGARTTTKCSSGACAPGATTSNASPARTSGASRWWTRARCSSASSHSARDSAGSARTPASSGPTATRGGCSACS